MKSLLAILLVVVSSVFVHYGIATRSEISRLENTIKLLDERNTTTENSLRDMIYAYQQLETKAEFEKQTSFISGIAEAVRDSEREDYYTKVWHNGYDRGHEVQKQMVESAKSQSLLDRPSDKSKDQKNYR